jgi:hypothetical protein
MQNHYPDFIYIGPPKTGTTFLRSYFSFHPEIYWIRKAQAFSQDPMHQQQYLKDIGVSIKEKCYIDIFESLATGIKILDQQKLSDIQFDPNIEVPKGVAYYDIEKVLRDIRFCLPKARILVSIRNQIDWMRSNYAHYISRLPHRQRRFSDFLQTFEGKGLLGAGHFHRTIEMLNDIFGSQNVHVCVLELIKQDQTKSLFQLCDFLQITQLPIAKEYENRNEGRSLRKVALLRMIPKGLREFVANELPRLRTASWINKAIEVYPSQELLSKSEIQQLENLYRQSNSISQQLLGTPLGELGYPI